MTVKIEFDFPTWFRATPLKHRAEKMVRGVFKESYEVAEVESSDVVPVLDIVFHNNKRRFADIEGQFYEAVGTLEEVIGSDRYRGSENAIPGLSGEWASADREALIKARESIIPLFPKQASATGLPLPELSMDWFSDGDRQWLGRQIAVAHGYLAKLRCCNGMVYEPIPEPVFVVMLRTDENGATSVSLEFTSSRQNPFFLGTPVAFFRGDEPDEAREYTRELASKFGVEEIQYTGPEVEVLERGRLSLEPYAKGLFYISEALASVHQNSHRGDLDIARAFLKLLGPKADRGGETPGIEVLSALEDLLRDCVEAGKTLMPACIAETALDRWESRPIEIAAATPAAHQFTR